MSNKFKFDEVPLENLFDDYEGRKILPNHEIEKYPLRAILLETREITPEGQRPFSIHVMITEEENVVQIYSSHKLQKNLTNEKIGHLFYISYSGTTRLHNGNNVKEYIVKCSPKPLLKQQDVKEILATLAEEKPVDNKTSEAKKGKK